MPKILVVEDTKECLEGLLELLELEGHEVTGCDSGQKAIAIIKSDRFDLIFCDVILPGITGWNVLQEVRSRGLNTPFCYITAMVSQSDKEVAARLGSDWYIAKPYSIADIREAITRLTGGG
jgi:two-component system OmpR family response regulator